MGSAALTKCKVHVVCVFLTSLSHCCDLYMCVHSCADCCVLTHSSSTLGEGLGRIYRGWEGFLRCLAAPPEPHDALPGAAARDCGHLGEPTPRGPVAFPLPAAALPDARPRPLHMSPEHPPRGEMLCERERSLPLHLPLHGGCGRSAGPHLHVHTTYARTNVTNLSF